VRKITLALAVGAFAVGASSLAACTSSEAEDVVEGAESAIASNVHVLSSRNDLARTSANPKESILTTSNVRAGTFGKVFTRNVDGAVFAQPLYVGGVNGKNVVYIATEHNSVYAFDADDMRATAGPIWTKNFGPSLPSADTGCSLLQPEIGITSTPVIDLPSKTMWFTTRNKEAGKVLHRLHAVDIATGASKPGSPVEIKATAAGNGDTSVGGVITFDPLKQMQRPGLLKVGNRIYLGFGSQCDIGPYHGWLMAYDATSLQQKSVLITTPNGGEGSIWNGGVGLNADDAGDIYFPGADHYANPNAAGPFNGAGNLGNSLVRVKDTGSAFAVQSTFTPFDTKTWAPRDQSLGPMGGILIPGTNLYVAGDKRGVNFVVDRTNMGGEAAGDSQIVQKFQGTAKGMWGGAAYYKKGAGGFYYLWGPGDRLKSYKFDGTKFLLPPQVNTTGVVAGYPGGALSVSSSNELAGTAILWTVRSKRTTSGLAASAGAGVLQAFDATDVSRELWSSDTNAVNMLGDMAKFAPPTIANGRVFVGTASKQLVAYGLLGGNPEPDAGPGTTDGGAPADSSTPTDAGAGPAPTWTQIYTQYIGPGTPGHCSGTGGCHTNSRGGFKCGTSKSDCYAGMVAAGLVLTTNGAQSPIGKVGQSPLAWLGGGMPLDNDAPNPTAAAAVQAWVAAGAKND